MKEITFWILFTIISLNFRDGYSIGLGSALSNIFSLSNPLNLLSTSSGNNGNSNSGTDDGADPEKVYPYVEFIHNHNYGIKLGRSFALGMFPNKPGNNQNNAADNSNIVGTGNGQFFNGRRTVTTGNNLRDGDDDDNIDSINNGSFVNRGRQGQRQGSQSQLRSSAVQQNRNNNVNNGYNYRPNTGTQPINQPNNNQFDSVSSSGNSYQNNARQGGYNYNQPQNGYNYNQNQPQGGYNYNPPSTNFDNNPQYDPRNNNFQTGRSNNGNGNINPNIEVTLGNPLNSGDDLEVNNSGNNRNFDNNSNQGQNFGTGGSRGNNNIIRNNGGNDNDDDDNVNFNNNNNNNNNNRNVGSNNNGNNNNNNGNNNNGNTATGNTNQNILSDVPQKFQFLLNSLHGNTNSNNNNNNNNNGNNNNGNNNNANNNNNSIFGFKNGNNNSNSRRNTRNDDSNIYQSNNYQNIPNDQFTSNSLLLANKKRPFDVDETLQNQIIPYNNNANNKVENNDIPLNVKITKNVQERIISTTPKPTTRFYPVPVTSDFLNRGDDIRRDPKLTKNLATANRDIVIRCPSGTNCVIYALSKSGVL